MSSRLPPPTAGLDAMIDARGTRHAAAGPAPRIACFVPSITELVAALGLVDRLVARTQFCIHPAAELAGVPALGGTKKASLPRLRALAPTHVILNIEENTAAMEAEMRAFVPHIIVTYPRRPEDNPPLYRLLGGIFGREAAAADLCRRFETAQARLAARTAALPARRVLYLIWKDPWMAVSRGTYIANMLALANWTTITHREGVDYPEVAITPALLDEADLVLFSTEPYAFAEPDLDAFARDHGCARAKLRIIDGEYCSWYGPRAIDGMEYLAGFAAA